MSDEKCKQLLAEELRCPICLVAFRLPSTIPCGHTFCRYCLSKSESCPLCRTKFSPETLSVNLVILNLLKRCGRDHRDNASPVGERNVERLEALEKWWAERMGRDKVPLNCLLSLALPEIFKISNKLVIKDFSEYLTHMCDTEELWSSSRHIINKATAVMLFDRIAADGNALDGGDQVQSWLEGLLESNLHLIQRKLGPSEPTHPKGKLTLSADRVHNLSEVTFDLNELLSQRAFVSGGRYCVNTITIPHSSVSSFHFLITEVAATPTCSETFYGLAGPPPNRPLCVLKDIGSSVGTMVLLDSEVILKDGWIIHLADRLEFKVEISPSAEDGRPPELRIQWLNLPNDGDGWKVDPAGMLIGQGFSSTAAAPVRDHCLILYGGTPACWRLVDVARCGVYLRLEPFKHCLVLDKQPVTFKIGQCRLEYTPATTPTKLKRVGRRRRTPSAASTEL